MLNGSSKIAAEHRRRSALVYVRQSSAKQVEENGESRRRQYELVGLAQSLGFTDVEVIDDDLGRSGSGAVERPGFEKLFRKVASGEVGAVFCLETSRLARNGRDWHTLLEVCQHLGTLIVSPEGVTDPRLGDDQLILGVKGTLAEYELSLFRRRGLEARLAKVKRGEYQMPLPIGLFWNLQGKVEKTPDARVRRVIEQIFAKFRELGSTVQAARWFLDQEIELPVLRRRKGRIRETIWRQACVGTIWRILKNPSYAGAYAWGRSRTEARLVNGRVRKCSSRSKPMSEWEVLIVDHHQGYIEWDDFMRNQSAMAANNYRSANGSRRSGRGGKALLTGLLRCGRCGRRMSVGYSGAKGNVQRYMCMSARASYGLSYCLSFSSADFDVRIAETLLDALQPMAIDAALEAAEMLDGKQAAERQLLVDELAHREYQARLAARRYESVDPDNRLVAATLERSWEGALEATAGARTRLAAFDEGRRSVQAVDREQLLALAENLEAVWSAPVPDPALKQRIVALMLEEVVVDVDEQQREIVAVLHWRGGRHSELRVPKRSLGQHRYSANVTVVELLKAASPRWSDHDLAVLLNRLGTTTGAGNPWTRGRVRSLRVKHKIPAFDAAEAARYVALNEACRLTGASSSFLRRLLKEGLLPSQQLCKGARIEILREDLARPDVVAELNRRHSGRGAQRESAAQAPLF